MKVYIAAPYAARDRIRVMADQVRGMGVEVTSSWLDEQAEVNDGTTGAAPELDDRAVSDAARRDLDDVDRSNLLVLLTGAIAGERDSKSGGRHVETGYALARGIPVLVVGEPENIFHRLARVDVVPDWASALVHIAKRALDDERRKAVPE